MLPNSHRGEVGLRATINGEPRDLVFALTTGALARLATFFGTSRNSEVFARLLGPVTSVNNADADNPEPVFQGPSFADIPAIICAVSGGGVAIDEAERLMPHEVGPLLEAVAKAAALALEGPVDAKKNDSASLGPMTSR